MFRNGRHLAQALSDSKSIQLYSMQGTTQDPGTLQVLCQGMASSLALQEPLAWKGMGPARSWTSLGTKLSSSAALSCSSASSLQLSMVEECPTWDGKDFHNEPTDSWVRSRFFDHTTSESLRNLSALGVFRRCYCFWSQTLGSQILTILRMRKEVGQATSFDTGIFDGHWYMSQLLYVQSVPCYCSWETSHTWPKNVCPCLGTWLCPVPVMIVAAIWTVKWQMDDLCLSL